MDVTYGLLSNLVQTKSIERILAPIASQVSLLIILNESNQPGSLSAGEMVPCAQAVMDATGKLVTVAKQQAQTSRDQELLAQTESACEVLDMSSHNLYVAAHRLEGDHVSREVRNRLVQASKDVLQGTMKVLLVSDDAEVRRLVTTTHIVTERVTALKFVQSMPDLVQKFREFTEALAVMTGVANRRQRDLTKPKQRERIVSALNVLKKCVPSLSVALQSAVKYPKNAQAEVSKAYIMTEVLSAVQDIVDAVKNREDITDEEYNQEEPGSFVTRIDQALEALSDEKREDLHPDIEMWTEGAVRHSMMVAHLCVDHHRDIIVKTSQRLLQVKGRVLQLYPGLKESPDIPRLREDYSEACEVFIDEFCELEKNVNISLLHLVVDIFTETTEPLERLVKDMVYTKQGDKLADQGDSFALDFEDHAEKMCQIANLAAASSTDAKRVRIIRTSVQTLEKLDPELVPAITAVAKHSSDKAAVQHLKLLMKEWTFELGNLLMVLDEMTDPRMFMHVSEKKVEDDINTCNGFLLTFDPHGFGMVLRSVVGRSRRVAQVAERIVDNHEDPMFRNGLMVYIKQLRKAITGVRAAGGNMISDIRNKVLIDTLRRRFTLLQDTLSQVKAGLSDVNHPHYLSPLRRFARQKEMAKEQAPAEQTSINMKRSKPLSRPVPPPSLGNKFITTSDPRLRPVPLEQEVPVVPQSAMLNKATSLSHNLVNLPYAKMLAKNLCAWATKGDKQKVNHMCGDLLGWTNHMVEMAQCVVVHCTETDKKKEIEGLCYDVDELAPHVIEKSKVVLLGDFDELHSMNSCTDEWGTKVEKLRIFVDVTVEPWKCTCDKVCDSVKARKTELAIQQLETVTSHQKALDSLVTLTESLHYDQQVKGHDLITRLWEDKDDLENITVTMKTTMEMVSDKVSTDDNLQIDQLGREWAVRAYCIVSDLEALYTGLLALGVERQVWPIEANAFTTDSQVLEYIGQENSRMKELLHCACVWEEDKKTVSRDLLKEMKECTEDLKDALLRKQPSGTSVTMVTAGYARHKVELLKGKWVLKAVYCVDLVRQQTSQYGRPVDDLVDMAFKVKAATNGSERDVSLSEFQLQVRRFTDNVATVRKKALHGIQLSTELEKRSMVRRCIDAITEAAPKVTDMVKVLADKDAPADLVVVSRRRQEWCVRARHLTVTLQQMSDLKPTLVPDILRLLGAEDSPVISDMSHSAFVETMATLQSSQHSKPSQHSKLSQNTPEQNAETVAAGQLSTVSVSITASNDIQGTDCDFTPVTVDYGALEEEEKQTSIRVHEASTAKTAGQGTKSKVEVTEDLTEARAISPRNVSALLATAEFFQRETERWEDENNAIVRVAKAMADQIHHMTSYLRGSSPIINHKGLIETAKAVASNGTKLLKFARILSKHCIEESFSKDLTFYADQITMVLQQLNILSNVQLAAADTETADRILVKNVQNLMRVTLRTLQAAEAVCIKGLKPPSGEEEDEHSALVLATRWQQRFIRHRQQEVESAEQDELGLRRIEDFSSPTLTQLLDRR